MDLATVAWASVLSPDLFDTTHLRPPFVERVEQATGICAGGGRKLVAAASGWLALFGLCQLSSANPDTCP